MYSIDLSVHGERLKVNHNIVGKLKTPTRSGCKLDMGNRATKDLQSTTEIWKALVSAIKANDISKVQEIMEFPGWTVGGGGALIKPVEIVTWQLEEDVGYGPNSRKNTPLAIAFEDHQVHLENVKCLIGYLPEGHSSLNTALLRSCYKSFGDYELLKWLIEVKGVEIEDYIAVHLGDVQILELFLENGLDLEDIIDPSQPRMLKLRVLDHFCCISGTDVRWLDVCSKHISLSKINSYSGFAPIEFAICLGNHSVVYALAEKHRVEVSNRTAYLLETQAWQVFPHFVKAIRNENHSVCLEMINEVPDLFEYVSIQDCSNILYESLWFSKKIVLKAILSSQHPLCYPREIWEVVSSYPEETVQLHVLKRRQDEAVKIAVLAGLKKICSGLPLDTFNSRIVANIMPLMICSSDCSFEWRFS
jgi:hypothetical protein